MESTTVTAANAATDASLAARTAAIANAPKTAAKPAKAPARPRPAKAPAPAPVRPATGRGALTPRERYARPATATIVAYVDFLEKNVVGRKYSKAERKAAEMSITLYGAYQSSPERRAARGY